MSSDSSRPSFRAYSKNKFKQVFKSNLTQSIISSEKLDKIRTKSENFTDKVKDVIHYDEIKNKTKSMIPERFQTKNENVTSVKGFFDSLFSPETEIDVYFKVAIICLWVIAMLFVLVTIITIFITYRRSQTKINVIKMIFFHIFLAEFFYLIYILLSMINVAMNFQLNHIWCNIAEYGMYVSVPMTCIILLILVIERLTRYLHCGASWTKIFTNLSGSQSILFVIWGLCIGILTIFIYVKTQVKETLGNLSGKFLPNRFNLNKLFSSTQCSIDGQLLPPFKVLFIILLVVLIVLIIKSVAMTTMYTYFKPTCCISRKKNKETIGHHMTLILILIILLNLCLSFPFYFISAYDSVRQFFSGNKTYPMRLKISFILRLTSIILQCLFFYIIEHNSWKLLCQLLNCITCRKFTVLKQNSTDISESISVELSDLSSRSEDQKKPNGIKRQPSGTSKSNGIKRQPSSTSKSNSFERQLSTSKSKSIERQPSTTKSNGIKRQPSTNKSNGIQRIPSTSKNNSITKSPSNISVSSLSSSSDDDDDYKFLPVKTPTTPKEKETKLPAIPSSDEDDSDNEITPPQKSILFNQTRKINSKPSQEKDEIKEENQSNKKLPSRYDLIKSTSNGKTTSHSQPSTTITTDRKTIKTNTTPNRNKYDPIKTDSSSSESSDSDTTSDEEEIQPKIHSSPNKQKSTSTKSPKVSRTNSSHVSPLNRTTSLNHNHNRRRTKLNRSQSANQTRTSKSHRSRKIDRNSHEV